MRKRSKLFSAVLAAAMAVTVVASSASVVKAAGKELDLNKLEDATYNEEVKVGDFTFVATADKSIVIETKEDAMVAADGKEFTKRMNFGGGVNQIKFNASKGEKVVVYTLSTGGDERQVGLFSPKTVDAATGKNTALATGVVPAKDQPIGVATFEIPEDGEYYIATVSKGMRVFYLSVGDVTAKQDSVPKTGVVSVAAICGAVALAGVGVAVVTGKKEN